MSHRFDKGFERVMPAFPTGRDPKKLPDPHLALKEESKHRAPVIRCLLLLDNMTAWSRSSAEKPRFGRVYCDPPIN